MYPNPLAKTAGTWTRYRLLKKRRSSTVRSSASLREDEVLEASAVGDDEETIAMCSEVGVIDSEVDSPPLNWTEVTSMMEQCTKEQMARGFLSNQSNISFILNTDGVPVFRSSFSFWPIYLIINELPYKMRYACLCY